MKIYNSKNVFESSLDRIRRIYDEFENVYVSHSSGKDSVIVMELAIMVAREKNRLPVDVCFCDQESEYEATAEYFRKLKNRPEVRLHWFQCPFVLSNSTSLSDKYNYLKCWNEEEQDKWMRKKEEDSIKDIGCPKDTRFHTLTDLMGRYVFKGEKYASLLGITAEESLNRYMLMHKEKPVYKDFHYCSRYEKQDGCFRFYPIYDWQTSDVWHAIAINHWTYNSLYDKMFKMGISKKNMRVSSLIHETGVTALKVLKEIEPKTFEKLTQRIGGINTYHILSDTNMFQIKKLPVMFGSWIEYRDYLIQTIVSEQNREVFLKQIKGRDTEEFAKEDVTSILVNDLSGTKHSNALSRERFNRNYKENRNDR